MLILVTMDISVVTVTERKGHRGLGTYILIVGYYCRRAQEVGYRSEVWTITVG